MIDFEFEFQYSEESTPTLRKVSGNIPAYPPQYSPEVLKKVMEQVENFEENN